MKHVAMKRAAVVRYPRKSLMEGHFELQHSSLVAFRMEKGGDFSERMISS